MKWPKKAVALNVTLSGPPLTEWSPPEELEMKVTSAGGASGRPECLCWAEAAH